VKRFRQQQRPKKTSLISGVEAVRDALITGTALDRIYMEARSAGEQFEAIKRLAKGQGIPVSFVPAAKLNSFNVNGHQGCIALIARVRYYSLQDIISFVTESGETPLFLILDGITDVRNIGGIARSAWSTGVHALIIPDKGIGALNEDAILTSAGALENLPVVRVNSLMKAVDELHLNGLKVYAADMKADAKVYEADFTVPCAIVLGSEEKGIYPALIKICDEKIMIPMTRDFESLNVSVAAGVILYEVMKQRTNATGH
jgi:23S rRNA (guanosine2251-2'-O)-methyltransferase